MESYQVYNKIDNPAVNYNIDFDQNAKSSRTRYRENNKSQMYEKIPTMMDTTQHPLDDENSNDIKHIRTNFVESIDIHNKGDSLDLAYFNMDKSL